MASDTIPIHLLCELNICYIYIPDANTQEIIDQILAMQYSYSIRAVSTVACYFYPNHGYLEAMPVLHMLAYRLLLSTNCQQDTYLFIESFSVCVHNYYSYLLLLQCILMGDAENDPKTKGSGK